MKPALKEALALLNRCRESIDTLLRQTDRPSERAARLAEMLRSLWPSSPLNAAVLKEQGNTHGWVLDAAGNPRPEWAKLLLRPPSQPAEAAGLAKPHAGMQLPDHGLAVQPVRFQDSDWGALALALPTGAPPGDKSLVWALLEYCADRLAFCLHLEACQRGPHTSCEELAGLVHLANVGELAGPLSHELNNFLNVILLQVAVLEQEVPEELRAEAAEIRQQGTRFAALVRQFQQYRQGRPVGAQRVELNRVVCETVEALRPGSGAATPVEVPVHLELAPDLPPIGASAAELKRLVTFLLTNAAAVSGDGSVTIRTGMTTDTVVLRMEDTGPALTSEFMSRMFEPGTAGREGTNSLELAACGALVRRLQGKVRGENCAEGGAAIVVELPAGRPGMELDPE